MIFNTLLLSKLNRWFCETPFVPTKSTKLYLKHLLGLYLVSLRLQLLRRRRLSRSMS